MKPFLLTFLLSFLPAEPVLAKAMGKAEFFIKGKCMAFDIHGENATVDGFTIRTKNEIYGTFLLRPDEFKTGIQLRDEHMCEALDCDKYPNIVFILDKISLSNGSKPMKGYLDMHGLIHEVHGFANIQGSEVIARFSIRLSDYQINAPEYKFGSVANNVDIRVELSL